MAKNKIYIVETAPGSYRKFTNWPACQAFVSGKPYPFAGGIDDAQAMAKIHHAKKKRTTRPGPAKKSPTKPVTGAADYPKTGICADAGTHGNPGPCEFQVADLKGNRLMHKHLGVHTNNYAELAGIGAMVQYAIEHGETELYTDSKIAMIWLEKGRLGPTVHEADLIMKMIVRIQKLLAEHPKLNLRKWHTKRWGEIPADFGRK